MAAYYNEFDAYAAEWLRNLIAAGHIAPGDVDERSIEDVRGEDLRGYEQVHLFAGIGGWSLALRMSGWPDDRPVWSGSCPCQPFSVAGRGAGSDDPRHLWPHMRRLVAECRPPTVFGEQVASAAVIGAARGGAAEATGPVWIDGVFDDLEAARYTCRASDLPAACVGAPHIRQRLWWVADRACGGQREHGGAPGQPGHADQRGASERVENAECCRGAWSVIGEIAGQGRQPVDTGPAGLRCDNGSSGADGPATHGPSGASERLADAGRAGAPCPGRWDEHGSSLHATGGPGTCGHRLADAERNAGEPGRLAVGPGEGASAPGAGAHAKPGRCGDPGGLVYPERDGRGPDQQGRGQDRGAATCGAGAGGGMGDAGNEGLERRAGQRGDDGAQLATAERAGSHWGSTWLACSDGTARRVEPAIPCLASRLPTRVDELCAGLQGMEHVPRSDASAILKQARRFRKGVLRGAGNAIVPQVAAVFIQAYLEATGETENA